MDKRVKWGIIILIIAGLTGLGLYRFLPKTNQKEATEKQASAPRQNAGRRALNVNALVVKGQTLIDDYSGKSRLIPNEEVDLSFQTSGLITHIYFNEGTTVKKGQLLAKVNDAPLQAQLKRLEAQVQLAEDRVFRQSALLEKDAVSKEAYEQVKTELAMLNADIQLILANIDLTELRAPFDGIIGLRQVSEGAYASPSIVIASLTNISPLKIDFPVNEKYTEVVKPGTQVAISVENDLNTYYAKVYAVDSKIDPITNTFMARAMYPNQNGRLKPGRTANLRIRMLEVENAVAIPSEAIVPEMGMDKVFLYRSGKAVPVSITKGLRTNALVQVVDGLQLGDTIITSGTLQLRNGLNVVLDRID
ncbi:efflux RND transporter periplasmic adaptor subunit [Bacteroides sp. OttesenSCG-928-M17]|nr:efflux RND transporter periplasmic adaptor subunit [Bacteroides sp. OttesenSCG-928-M17]